MTRDKKGDCRGELAEIEENPGGIEGVEGEWEGYNCEGWGISKKLKRGFARKCFSKSFFSIRISRKVVESSKSKVDYKYIFISN